ncbi:MAG: hypothetical protein P8168_04940 [Deltaproteobacteria bacterium]|jgi:hypothetical protein
MGYSLSDLKQRLLEHHSDIVKHGVQLNVSPDPNGEGYVVELAKGDKKSEIFISQKDADECLQGIECYHLGIELGNFLREFKETI